ncbi:hypothetical protein N182_31990 [Sinorhizobium sp. GL2]|nr:hypothetical protein N182_31990 [Sinorhizobium sp. GL2]
MTSAPSLLPSLQTAASFAADEMRSLGRSKRSTLDRSPAPASLSPALSVRLEIVTPVQSEQWFTIRDPDGNVLMICRC